MDVPVPSSKPMGSGQRAVGSGRVRGPSESQIWAGSSKFAGFQFSVFAWGTIVQHGRWNRQDEQDNQRVQGVQRAESTVHWRTIRFAIDIAINITIAIA